MSSISELPGVPERSVPGDRVRSGTVSLDPKLMDIQMSRMVKFLVCVAAVAACCEVEAGGRSFTRQSSRAQSSSGSHGHFVGLPGNSFEGVGVGSSPREAINNACQPGGSRRMVSKSVTRGANGQYYASVLYK
ncbi:MAG: hypothetical protein DWH81_01980 [Planctomycetota bacterium]|nr:MAG: hypothetical protein DWH81_01980 [Planctomycetota bacterium]